LFTLDAAALFLFERDGTTLRRVASVGHRSEFAAVSGCDIPPELIQQIRAVRRDVSLRPGLPLPRLAGIAEEGGDRIRLHRHLWSKEKNHWRLTVACRAVRDFTPADISLLIAVAAGSSAVERSVLYDETRQLTRIFAHPGTTVAQ